MVLRKVFLTSDTYSLCVAHAFTNEKEEIMGLLIGETDQASETCNISSAMILKRSDKRPDRVEISPEQLSNASNHAEQLGEKLKRPMRIVGWYHSHPHITVWPSSVDIRTQASYQMMDKTFIGLIFSVFNQDKSNVNHIQVCCFQSKEMKDGSYEKVDVDLQIVPSESCQSVIDSYLQLPDIIWQEEKDLYENSKSKSLDVASTIYNQAVYTQNAVQILECIHVPVINFMKNKLHENEVQIELIKKQKEELKMLIEKERKKSLEKKSKSLSDSSPPDDMTSSDALI